MPIMIIATIIICIFFTVTEVTQVKKNPVAGLHNLPMDIQERVHNMPEYTGKTGRILSTKKDYKEIAGILAVL